jgi:hypothetical protein
VLIASEKVLTLEMFRAQEYLKYIIEDHLHPRIFHYDLNLFQKWHDSNIIFCRDNHMILFHPESSENRPQ